jgi:hypothetical protein
MTAHISRVAGAARTLFNLIAEPRVTRIIWFVIYTLMIAAGAYLLLAPPTSFENTLGGLRVFIFGAFILLGGVLAGFAVLPGIWWLERAGIISLVTGLLIYAALTVALGSSVLGTLVCVAFAGSFLNRWRDIKAWQLAPKKR